LIEQWPTWRARPSANFGVLPRISRWRSAAGLMVDRFTTEDKVDRAVEMLVNAAKW
jgi:hypothetical protein